MRLESRQQIAVVLAAFIVFFTALGRPYLWDEDEPKNAECAREMYEAGNWAVPQFNYELRTDKPILLYWLMLAAYHVGGVTEFTARFWSAALAVGTTLLTYHLGRRLYRAEVGLWAGLAIATCMMFAVSGRAATPDSTLIFFTTLTLYLFVRFGGVEAGLLRRGGYTAMYAAMGCAVLAKGPVGIALPGGIMGLFLLCRSQQTANATSQETSTSGVWYRRWLSNIVQALAPRRIAAAAWSLRPLTLLFVVGAIALPWYITVGVKTDGAWLAGFLGKHNVSRFTGAMEGHSGPVVYYIVAVMIGFFPWSCLLPIGVYRLVRRLRDGAADESRATDTFLACWAGLYIAFFSLAGTKLPSYVLPCYPALALLTGKLIDEQLRDPSRVPRLWYRWALYTPAIIGAALCIGLPVASSILFPGEEWLGIVGLSLIVGSGLLVWTAHRGRPWLVPAAFATMSLVFTTSMVAGLASRLSLHATSPQIVAAAREKIGPDARLIAFRHYEPTLVYYARGAVPSVHSVEELRRLLLATPDACVVTRDEFLPELNAAFATRPVVAARHRRFLRRRGEIVLVDPPPVVLATLPAPERR